MAKQNKINKDEKASLGTSEKVLSKASTKAFVKKTERVMDVTTFCDIKVPGFLDKFVGKKKFPSERLTIKQWGELFDKSGIPYKK